MERSEPALVPEWLRSAGSLTGGGNSTNHFLSGSSHSDVASLGHHNRNRTTKSISDFDNPRSPVLDRSSSSNSRRSSNINGSTKHAYSSFSRSNRERDRDRDKERSSSFGDHWDRDCSDPFGIILTRVENDTLRRSHSMVTRKQGELMLRKASVDSKLGIKNNHYGNGTHLGVSTAGSIHKVVFEKDFPSLANEERQGVTELGRVPSPGLSTAAQSLPISNSALIGEGWRSALVEVPPPPVQQTPVGTSVATNTVAGLNMAEALAQQASPRTSAAPQLSVKIQRLEELAIKQSRQLIPVTPTMPKTSVLSSSDKSKPKLAARSGEMVLAAKSGQQQPSSLQRVGNVKSDASKTTHGKFLVLKPVWENGLSPGPKDVSSPANNAGNRIPNSQPPLVATPSVASVPLKSPNDPKHSTVDRKSLNPGSTLEKRPSSAQAQSRKDFLNLMRKKSSMNTAAVVPDPGPETISSSVGKSDSEMKELVSAPINLHTIENGGEATRSGITYEESRFSDVGGQNLSPDISVYPDEEEAAFLRSLGWEENGGEDEEGLTEEEINAFYQEYMKLRPSVKLCGSVLPKLATMTESHVTGIGGTSSDSRSEV